MFLSRLRLVLGLGGMAFLLAGIARGNRLIVWGAIGLLGGSFLVRLYLRKREG